MKNTTLKEQVKKLWGNGKSVEEIEKILGIELKFNGMWPAPAIKRMDFTILKDGYCVE